MMGDFNARSRVDNWFYNYPENDTRLLVHDHIRNNTDLVDIIAERNPGRFISSTYGNARIDFMYASPSMYGRVANALIVIDQVDDGNQESLRVQLLRPLGPSSDFGGFRVEMTVGNESPT